MSIWYELELGLRAFKSPFLLLFLTQNLYENWDWRQFSLHLVSIFGSLESADLHSGDEGEGNAGNGGSAVLLAIIVDHRKPSCGRSFRSRSPTSSQSLLCRSCWSLMSELMTFWKWGLFHLQPHRCSQLCSWRAVVIFILFPIKKACGFPSHMKDFFYISSHSSCHKLLQLLPTYSCLNPLMKYWTNLYQSL